MTGALITIVAFMGGFILYLVRANKDKDKEIAELKKQVDNLASTIYNNL